MTGIIEVGESRRQPRVAVVLASCFAVCLSCSERRGGVPAGGAGGTRPVDAGGSGGSGGAGVAGAGGSQPTGGASPTPGGGSGPGGISGAGGGGGGPVVVIPPMSEPAGPMALRRLTRREYEATVVDLLGNSPAVLQALPDLPDYDSDPLTLATVGFRAPTQYNEVHVEELRIASLKLADAAFAAGTLTPPCTAPPPGMETTVCGEGFIKTFGRRVFRRPPTAAEAADLLAVFTAAVEHGFDVRGALRYVVSAMLQSPNFLNHWEAGDTKPPLEAGLFSLTPHQVASRLSYFLWGTMPDETLLAAADAGQLSTTAQLSAQAQRMLAVPSRMGAGLTSFHEQWLETPLTMPREKDPRLFPGFTPSVDQALGVELSTFVTEVLSANGDGTLKTLLTAPYTYVNGQLAVLYGGASSSSGPFVRFPLNPLERAGLLTQGLFLATHATMTAAAPVSRGLWLWRRVLCGARPSGQHPPEDQPLPDTGGTNRERFARQTTISACAECHSSFDPLGFAFENYDAIGAYQTLDHGKAVDATGEVFTPAGSRLAFRNAIELVQALADSDEVKRCVTRQWFRFAMGRLETTTEQPSIEFAYQTAALVPGHSVRGLLGAIVQTKPFRYRAPSTGE